MDTAPYEKMYMIDEAELMKFKNIQYPTALEDQPSDIPPDDDDDDDESVDIEHQYQPPARIPRTPPTPPPRTPQRQATPMRMPTPHELQQNSLEQELNMQNATMDLIAANETIEDLDREFAEVMDSIRVVEEAEQEKKQKVREAVEQFESFDDWVEAWNELQEAINQHHDNPMVLREMYKTVDIFKQSQYYEEFLAARLADLQRELDNERRLEMRKAQVARGILGAVRPEVIDLDSIDSSIELLNATFPPPVLVQMPIPMQEAAIGELLTMSAEEVSEVIAYINASLEQSFAEQGIPYGMPQEWMGRPRQTSTPAPAKPPRMPTPAQPPRMPAGKTPPHKEWPKDGPIDILFTKGRNKDWMNKLYTKMVELKIIRPDAIKRAHGEWAQIDTKKLIKRLVSNSHGKLVLPHPSGYKTVLGYLEVYPNLLKYVGEYIRADFKRTHKNFKLPDRLPLGDKK